MKHRKDNIYGNDSLHRFAKNETILTGTVPYDSEYDMGPNGKVSLFCSLNRSKVIHDERHPNPVWLFNIKRIEE